MNHKEAYELLTGHGHGIVQCKLCFAVLACCRCMAPHEPIYVICDNCLKKAEGESNE
jgi:predicted amidophosphoribosyltransferase